MQLHDTIAAISTPPGRGGIGIIRLSGPDARAIAEKIVRRLPEWKPWTATLAELTDADARTIDRVVLTYFAAPRSYTAEDVVEIACHGSPVVLRHALERACTAGARLAEPGEFTLRAYINGRIDLPQAEAIRDLIDATTLYQARIAAQQAEGSVSLRIQPVKEQMLELISLLEAGIDFAEDDISVASAEDILARLDPILSGVRELIASFAYGKLVHAGFTLAVVGRPNVGKSSLFNRLLEQDRAIVTEIPGTTRDLVSETASLDGIPVKFVDTAGIRKGQDLVETLGIERSYRAMADADVTLVVVDISAPLETEDRDLIRRASDRGRHLVVGNKCDLGLHPSWQDTPLPRNLTNLDTSRDLTSRDTSSDLTSLDPTSRDPTRRDLMSRDQRERLNKPHQVSALTGEGIAELRRRIMDIIAPQGRIEQDGGFITSLRHELLLKESREALQQARHATLHGIPHEMLLLDLYAGLRPIDAITGATTADDILNRIFSTFCIGK